MTAGAMVCIVVLLAWRPRALFPGWDTLETVRAVRDFFEVTALVLFAVLVLFETLALLSKQTPKKEHFFEVAAVISFALAVLCEVYAYPYSRRIDTLADRAIAKAIAEAQVKPLKQRVIEALNCMDPNVTFQLAKENRDITVVMPLPMTYCDELRKLCAERGAAQYITLVSVPPEKAMTLQTFGPHGSEVITTISFRVSTNLLAK